MDYTEYRNPGFSVGHHAHLHFRSEMVAVWELSTNEEVLQPDVFELISTYFVSGYRQIAQDGVFTRLDHEKHLDVEAYLKDRGLAHFLAVYLIPAMEAPTAFGDLLKMNIDPATVFPDFQGAASMAHLAPLLFCIGWETNRTSRRR
jgi:hypothetical protein